MGVGVALAYVGLKQRFWTGELTVQVTYGLTGRSRTAGFDLRQYGTLQLESRF